MPAVVAPGGSLVHFVPTGPGTARFDDVDFVGEGTPDAGTPTLQAIDPHCLRHAANQLDGWILFRRAHGLDPGDSFRTADADLIRTASRTRSWRAFPSAACR